MIKKKALGKGLGALIPELDILEKITENDQIIELNIDEVFPNRNQPRKEFDEEKLKLLQDSIESNGIIQPIIVSKEKVGYQIIAGERRWRASRMANLKKIPSIIRSYDDLMKAKVSIIENVQRDDLNPVEEARAYELLLKNYDLSKTELGQSIGKSRSYISNMIRILELDESILESINVGDISFGHAKALLMFPEEKRIVYWIKTLKDKLSVRQLEKLTKIPEKSDVVKIPKDLEIIKLEKKLSDSFGTKVLIKMGENKGKIEIDFYDEKDLERIIELLRN
ncbi:MAG: ParB/RepB/Spo0J family partition protein [Clostridiales bacterium]|nr:ParB/RepB/Spo0J family partition protein [Clostridiales bacterium]